MLKSARKFNLTQPPCLRCRAPALSGTISSTMKRHSSMTSPGDGFARIDPGSSCCFCRVPCEGTVGLVQQLLEVLVLAALAGGPRLRRSENVGQYLCKL